MSYLYRHAQTARREPPPRHMAKNFFSLVISVGCENIQFSYRNNRALLTAEPFCLKDWNMVIFLEVFHARNAGSPSSASAGGHPERSRSRISAPSATGRRRRTSAGRVAAHPAARRFFSPQAGGHPSFPALPALAGTIRQGRGRLPLPCRAGSPRRPARQPPGGRPVAFVPHHAATGGLHGAEPVERPARPRAFGQCPASVCARRRAAAGSALPQCRRRRGK